MGDNRDQSLDSRYWGFVGAGDLIGRPLLIYNSQEGTTDEAMEVKSWGTHRERWGRIFKLL